MTQMFLHIYFVHLHIFMHCIMGYVRYTVSHNALMFYTAQFNTLYHACQIFTRHAY